MDTVFFIASKLIGATLRVETWLLLIALLTAWSVWRGRLTLAKWSSGGLIVMILGVGVLPLGDVMLRPMEASYDAERIAEPFDGIVVLGGGEDIGASMATGLPQLGEGGDRYLKALELAHRDQDAVVLFAGGGGRLRDINGAEVSEARIAELVFLSQGIARERLIFEDRSRNTAENAAGALELAAPAEDARWALVTSAFHMPRAMRSFEAAGWSDLVPVPTDYRARLWADGLGWNFARNLMMLNTGIKEWVGRVAYAVTGR